MKTPDTWFVMKRLLASFGITLVAVLLFILIYPAIRGAAANSPHDKLGEMILTFGIPTVMLGCFYWLMYLGRK